MSAAAQHPVSMMQLIAQYAPEQSRVRIVSIYPIECRKELLVEKGFKVYVLPKAERGKWSFCDVDTTFQWMADRSESGLEERKGDAQMVPMLEQAADRAAALVKYWSSDLSLSGAAGGGRPGIIALAPGQSEPSEELLAQLNAQQDKFADTYITHGNDLVMQGKAGAISDLHRRMAQWKLGDAASRLTWVQQQSFQGLKRCLACAEEIPVLAARCKHCSTDLLKFYRDNGLDTQDDPGLTALLAARKIPAPDPKVPIKNQVRLKLDEKEAAQTAAPGRPLSPPVTVGV